MKVTPYGHVPIDGRAAALDCQKTAAPLSWVEKKTKKTQMTINYLEATRGGR